jgi:hypothetical protein
MPLSTIKIQSTPPLPKHSTAVSNFGNEFLEFIDCGLGPVGRSSEEACAQWWPLLSSLLEFCTKSFETTTSTPRKSTSRRPRPAFIDVFLHIEINQSLKEFEPIKLVEELLLAGCDLAKKGPKKRNVTETMIYPLTVCKGAGSLEMESCF